MLYLRSSVRGPALPTVMLPVFKSVPGAIVSALASVRVPGGVKGTLLLGDSRASASWDLREVMLRDLRARDAVRWPIAIGEAGSPASF